jgi:hypothetical protein
MDERTQERMPSHLHQPRPEDLPDLPEDDPIAVEWKIYKREIARLLAEGFGGKFALVKGDAVISIWDTERDALQAGQERFDQGPFLVQKIQPTLRPQRHGYRRLSGGRFTLSFG